MTVYRARSTELSWREVDGEVVLLDERDWSYLHLNGSGALLWGHLSGEHGATADALTEALTRAYAVDAADARADVEALLVDLVARALVVVE